MTKRMMRLFDNVTQARTFIKEDQGISLAKAKVYVERNTVRFFKIFISLDPRLYFVEIS